MKRMVIFALALCLVLPAVSAMADDGGWTVSLKAGYGFGDISGGATDPGVDANATSTGFDDEDGWLAAMAVGYDWSGQGVDLRTEVEYSFYHGVDYDAQNTTAADKADMSADIDVQTLMFNVYYDFENSTSFTPYIGVGAGIAMISCDVDYGAGYGVGVNVADGDADATNFAWSVSGGVSYELTDYVDLDLQVRYVDFGDTDEYADGNYKFQADDLSSTDVLIGVRYTF
ncbi:MAG: outer membrane protein [Desulfovibrionaceae bacterium]